MTWIATGRARQARERAGWTAPQVAERCGVTVRTVYRWENEGRTPNGATATRYYELLDRWLNSPEPLLEEEREGDR
jgi:transcriptional regulator with XRE-family HTH domain